MPVRFGSSCTLSICSCRSRRHGICMQAGTLLDRCHMFQMSYDLHRHYQSRRDSVHAVAIATQNSVPQKGPRGARLVKPGILGNDSIRSKMSGQGGRLAGCACPSRDPCKAAPSMAKQQHVACVSVCDAHRDDLVSPPPMHPLPPRQPRTKRQKRRPLASMVWWEGKEGSRQAGGARPEKRRPGHIMGACRRCLNDELLWHGVRRHEQHKRRGPPHQSSTYQRRNSTQPSSCNPKIARDGQGRRNAPNGLLRAAIGSVD